MTGYRTFRRASPPCQQRRPRWPGRLGGLLVGLALTSAALPASPRLQITVDPPAEALRGLDLAAYTQLAEETCDAPAWRLQRHAQDLPEQLTQALRAFGYYAPEVTAEFFPATADKACWSAEVRIQPGEPVRISRRQITVLGEAQALPALPEAIAASPVQPGAILHHGDYEALKRTLMRLLTQQGYLDARWQQAVLRVNPDALSAEVILTLDSGSPYRIGTLSYQGELPLSAQRLQRISGIRTGDPYTSRTLVDLYSRFQDSGYFDSVQVQPKIDARDDSRVPIDIELSPAPRHSWRLGVGARSDTGPRASADYTNRRLNARGDRLHAQLTLSPALSELGGDYRFAIGDHQRESYTARFGAQHEVTDSSTSDLASLGVAYSTLGSALTRVLSLDLSYETSSLGGDDLESWQLVPGAAWTWRSGRAQDSGAAAVRAHATVKGSDPLLLSDTRFLYLTGGLKTRLPLGPRQRLILRLDSGAVLTEDFDELPVSYRFFAGGDDSIRGYGFESIGPSNAEGDVIGGQYLLTASAELEHQLSGQWAVAAFYDLGDAFTDTLDPQAAWGLGGRWRTDFIQVRLDVAVPEDRGLEAYRIHFGIGAEF